MQREIDLQVWCEPSQTVKKCDGLRCLNRTLILMSFAILMNPNNISNMNFDGPIAILVGGFDNITNEGAWIGFFF